MTAIAKQLLDQAMNLNEDDRLEVADRLYSSVSPRADQEYIEAWSTEISERIAAHECGTDAGVSWETLRAELLSDEGDDV